MRSPRALLVLAVAMAAAIYIWSGVPRRPDPSKEPHSAPEPQGQAAMPAPDIPANVPPADPVRDMALYLENAPPEALVAFGLSRETGAGPASDPVAAAREIDEALLRLPEEGTGSERLKLLVAMRERATDPESRRIAADAYLREMCRPVAAPHGTEDQTAPFAAVTAYFEIEPHRESRLRALDRAIAAQTDAGSRAVLEAMRAASVEAER